MNNFIPLTITQQYVFHIRQDLNEDELLSNLGAVTALAALKTEMASFSRREEKKNYESLSMSLKELLFI